MTLTQPDSQSERHSKPVKGIIFDLDRCVFDTDSMGIEVLNPVIDALKTADVNRFFSPDAEHIKDQLWKEKLEEVIVTNGIPPHIGKAMKKAYQKLKATHGIQPYEDIILLPYLNQKKILVTSGYEYFQRSKIQMLNISHYFDEIIIDAIDEKQRGKKEIFNDLAKKYRRKPSQVAIIGDNPKSELKA